MQEVVMQVSFTMGKCGFLEGNPGAGGGKMYILHPMVRNGQKKLMLVGVKDQGMLQLSMTTRSGLWVAMTILQICRMYGPMMVHRGPSKQV